MKATIWLISLQPAASWTLGTLRAACTPRFVAPIPPPSRLSCRSRQAPWPLRSSLDNGGDKLAVAERFQAWLLEQGVGLPSCGLKLEWAEGSGFGLYCTREVEMDSILVNLPPTLALTPQVPVPHPALPSLARLALRLLYEKALCSLPSSSTHALGGGRYGPYLAVLPALGEMDLPLLWTHQEVALLGPSPLHDDVVELRNDVASERAALLHRLQEALHHLNPQAGEGKEAVERAVCGRLMELLQDEEEWVWARAIVMSRPYYMTPGDEESLQLLPLLDMLNHDDDVDYAVLPGDGIFTDRDCATLHVDRDYRLGQQVMGTYGPLSSASKLYSFGYLDRPHIDPMGAEIPMQGTAFLTFSLEPGQVEDAEQEGWKADVLRGLSMRAAGERFEVATRLSVKEAGSWSMEVEDSEALEQMLRYLRLKHLDPSSTPIKSGREADGMERGRDMSAQGLSSEAVADIWESLGQRLEGDGEERVRREVREECERQERLAEARLAKLRVLESGQGGYDESASGEAMWRERRGDGEGVGALCSGKGGLGREGRVKGLVRRLVEGEILALKAIKAHICSQNMGVVVPIEKSSSD